jgi:hypothetical protein
MCHHLCQYVKQFMSPSMLQCLKIYVSLCVTIYVKIFKQFMSPSMLQCLTISVTIFMWLCQKMYVSIYVTMLDNLCAPSVTMLDHIFLSHSVTMLDNLYVSTYVTIFDNLRVVTYATTSGNLYVSVRTQYNLINVLPKNRTYPHTWWVSIA